MEGDCTCIYIFYNLTCIRVFLFQLSSL